MGILMIRESEGFKKFVDACRAFIAPNCLRLDEPMKLHTTFEIGGPADCLIFPASKEEAERVLALVKAENLPLTILGNGSNILVRDKGIRGVIVKFARPMSRILVEGNIIRAEAGAMLKDVSEVAAQNGLTGLEFACGIPGSIGGAVFMNAGAYGGEMKNIVSEALSVDTEGNLHAYEKDALKLGYRHSIFQTNGEAIVEVSLTLVQGDRVNIRQKMKDYTRRRESKQPLDMPSAGSTFKRPTGYFAGTLIDQAGLKGFSVGGAQVSTKHAGFVVNADHATAEDVQNLIKEVQKHVKEAHGVDIYPEVRVIGDA